MSVIIKGGASSNLADVDANGNLEVNLPTTKSQSGYVGLMSINHDGASGAAKVTRETETTSDFRLRVGGDSLLWHETFNHTTQQNASAYQIVTSTMTTALSNNSWAFNSGGALASGNVARGQTYRTFSVYQSYPTYVEMACRLTAAPQASQVIEFGLGIATTTTTPTDGVYFKYNTSGALQGVANFNGTETTVSLSFTPTVNNVDRYVMAISYTGVEFWINDILYGSIARPATSPGLTLANALPVLIRIYNSSAVSTALQFQVCSLTISQGDLNSLRLWSSVNGGRELNCINNPYGSTSGQLANYANSAAPASATLSNTAAGYTTLGGQFQFAAVAGAETDYALFGYNVPSTAAAAANLNLMIRGVRIETFNMGAASATTPTLLQWALGVGSTAVSLATTDSLTAGTRAPRRIALGVQSIPVGAAIGASVSPVDVNFDAPILSSSGSFVHIILKMPVGTATASQIIRGTVTINGYFE